MSIRKNYFKITTYNPPLRNRNSNVFVWLHLDRDESFATDPLTLEGANQNNFLNQPCLMLFDNK